MPISKSNERKNVGRRGRGTRRAGKPPKVKPQPPEPPPRQVRHEPPPQRPERIRVDPFGSTVVRPKADEEEAPLPRSFYVFCVILAIAFLSTLVFLASSDPRKSNANINTNANIETGPRDSKF